MAVEYIRRLQVEGPDMSEKIDVPEGSITIGRQAGNPVRLNNPMISRKHAQIDCTPAGCQVMDLGSANGTMLDGVALPPKSPSPLKGGSVIQCGPFTMTFEEIAIEPIDEPPPPPPPKKKAPPRKRVQKKEPAPKPPPPPAPPPPPPPPAKDGHEPDYSKPPPGVPMQDSNYLEYLPGIYQNDFMGRFLAIFEAVLSPIEWNVNNFDMYLDPNTTPEDFTPWLANWFEITFDPTWSLEKRRTLLSEADQLFGRRGTRWALSRILEIYTGQAPEILDQEEGEDAFTFTVKLPFTESELDRRLIEQIVDASKPAHTNYKLEFKRSARARRK